MKKLGTIITLAIMAFLGTANDSQAISLRFKFKVFSSGPSIYACNAGIRHKTHNSKVCYFEGTTTACTPDDCKDKTVCNTSCVCTGTNGGDSLMDYLKVESVNWTDHKATGDNSAVTGLESITKSAPYGGAWSYAISDNATTWNKRIKELSFNLGSELYGAEYFVDVCYRGPQIEYFADGVTMNATLSTQVSATDFFATGVNPGDNSRDGLIIPGAVDGKTYSDLAGLQVKAYYACDMQGVGGYKYAHNGATSSSGTYNTSINEANFGFDGNGYPVTGTDIFGSSGSFQPIAGNGLDLINTWISTSSKAPRFCKIRYVFSETNQDSSLPFMRKWQRHGAEVCTYTKIEEDISE
jgi:hypothetical protein